MPLPDAAAYPLELHRAEAIGDKLIGELRRAGGGDDHSKRKSRDQEQYQQP
jgi:hypothetical protein